MLLYKFARLFCNHVSQIHIIDDPVQIRIGHKIVPAHHCNSLVLRFFASIYKGKSLKELKSEDKKRAKYYEFYTGEKWGNPENYDLVINTAKMSLEKAADLIIEYINLMKNK